MTELTDSFRLLKTMLEVVDKTDNQPETHLNNNESKATSAESDIDNGTANPDKNGNETNLVSYRSSYELETILIFDLCALSEIATSKSAILRVSVPWH